MQKGLRNQWEPWIWELLTAASGDGVGDEVGSGAGGRDTLFSALAPVCPSRVSFRSLRTSASLCHTVGGLEGPPHRDLSKGVGTALGHLSGARG